MSEAAALSELPVSRILSALLSRGGEHGELFFEEVRSLTVLMEDGRIERVVSGTDAGIGVRLLFRGKTFYAYTNDRSAGSLLALSNDLSRYAEGDGVAAALPASAQDGPRADRRPRAAGRAGDRREGRAGAGGRPDREGILPGGAAGAGDLVGVAAPHRGCRPPRRLLPRGPDVLRPRRPGRGGGRRGLDDGVRIGGRDRGARVPRRRGTGTAGPQGRREGGAGAPRGEAPRRADAGRPFLRSGRDDGSRGGRARPGGGPRPAGDVDLQGETGGAHRKSARLHRRRRHRPREARLVRDRRRRDARAADLAGRRAGS